MFLLALLACGSVCRKPEVPLVCSAAATGPDRSPVTAPTDPVRGWFGVQGGAHIEIALDLTGTSSAPDIAVDVIDAEGRVVSQYGPFPTVLEIVDPDACTPETVQLEVPFSSGDDICDLDGEALRMVVTVTRSDGDVATCETAGVLASDTIALDIFCSPDT